MNIKHHQHSCAGYGSIVAMIILTIVVTFAAVALSLTSTFARQAGRQRTVLHAQGASDSAVEYIYAKWKKDIKTNAYAPVATTSFALPSTLHPALAASPSSGTGLSPLFNPWPLTFPATVSYTTTDQWGAATGSATTVKVANVPGYPGWSGNSTFYKAEASTTTPSLNAPVTQGVRRYLQLTFVPLFQAAIFYEDDLEIHPGPPMTITGLVHTNKDLEVLAYDKLQFMNDVSYSGAYRETAPGNWSGTGSGSGYTNPTEKPYWKDDLQSDTSVAVSDQLKKVDRMEPLGTRPAQVFNTTDANTNNDGFREIIEKPATGSGNPDPPEIAATRFYNKASLKIEVNSSKTSTDPAYLKVFDNNNSPVSGGVFNQVKAAILGSTDMYDQREGANIKVTSLDMNKFNAVITQMGSNYNGVVYITDTSTDASKDAIRLVNGRILNSDITVATDKGMYIQGDFNTGGNTAADVPSNGTTSSANHTAPGYTEKSTAVAADAVTILSNSWNDGNAGSQLSSRVATNTTVNTGIVAGNVPSNYNSSGNPSGGVHNFPRFLELWYNLNTNQEVNFTYYGSMVELFQSKLFTGLWYTNNTYWPPNRIWNFDPLFRNNPPKGTLQATQFSRGRWERF
jgi:type II secretory pathway pseudopilin PulG